MEEIIKKEKELLEGKDAGTSPAPEAEEEEATVELNNTTVPTPEEEENAEIVQIDDATAETEPAPEEESGEPESDGVAETSATEPMFTQSQVDEIAGKVRKETREKVTKDFFSRYGVNSSDELDDLFGDAQRFVTAREEYGEKEKAWKEADELRGQELLELKERVALLSSGIDKDRYEDAKFILKGKGLEVTEENIANELATHPEWKVQEQTAPKTVPFAKKPEPATQIKPINVLGNEGNVPEAPGETDYQKAMKMFKV